MLAVRAATARAESWQRLPSSQRLDTLILRFTACIAAWTIYNPDEPGLEAQKMSRTTTEAEPHRSIHLISGNELPKSRDQKAETFLLRNEEDAFKKSQEKRLFDAIRASDEQAVQDLIASGVDVKAREGDGYFACSALTVAFEERKDAIATLLIRSGALSAATERCYEEYILDALKTNALSQAAVLLLELADKVSACSLQIAGTVCSLLNC